jgi:glycosyltransferase involved in cell wall biosynthesis
MGFAQDMGNLIGLARRLHHRDDAHFLFIGDGDQVELVTEAAKTLDNISYFPSVRQGVFASILRRVDIGLFTLAREHTAHNFPGKLLGYMQNEVPILGSINPGNDLQSVIEGAQAGIVTVNGDDDALRDAAVKMLNDPALRRSMGKNALHLRDALFSVEGVAETILQAYRREGSGN